MENITQYSPGDLRETADEGAALLREIEKSTKKLLLITEKLMEEYNVKDSEQLIRNLRLDAGAVMNSYSMQIRHLYMAAELYEKSAGAVLAEAEQILKGAGLQIL